MNETGKRPSLQEARKLVYEKLKQELRELVNES